MKELFFYFFTTPNLNTNSKLVKDIENALPLDPKIDLRDILSDPIILNYVKVIGHGHYRMKKTLALATLGVVLKIYGNCIIRMNRKSVFKDIAHALSTLYDKFPEELHDYDPLFHLLKHSPESALFLNTSQIRFASEKKWFNNKLAETLF